MAGISFISAAVIVRAAFKVVRSRGDEALMAEMGNAPQNEWLEMKGASSPLLFFTAKPCLSHDARGHPAKKRQISTAKRTFFSATFFSPPLTVGKSRFINSPGPIKRSRGCHGRRKVFVSPMETVSELTDGSILKLERRPTMEIDFHLAETLRPTWQTL